MQPLPNPEPVAHLVDAAAVADWPARVPLRQAAMAQIGACLVVLILGTLLSDATETSHMLMSLALLQGVVAAGLGRGLKMDPWWLPIHALFVPGLVWTQALCVPPGYALGAFCLLASLYWGVSRTRVPLFLSSRVTMQAVANLLPRERSFTFLDMGCGLGGVLTSLAQARPAGRYHGIESAPMPFLLSRLRTAFRSRLIRITWGDFNAIDLEHYDVVFAYLSPAAMGDVWRKARSEMRPGSLLISNSFAVPGVAPAVTIATGARDGSRLLLWRM
ncbi:MAG: class I SAM-dependent methyltransferase [Comamonadaceae bacterium]